MVGREVTELHPRQCDLSHSVIGAGNDIFELDVKTTNFRLLNSDFMVLKLHPKTTTYLKIGH